MKIKINLELIDELKLTPNEYIALYCKHKEIERESYGDLRFSHLQEQGWLNEKWELADKWLLQFSEDFNDYSKKVFKEYSKADINCEVDLRNHNLNFKIREHSLTKVPLLLICGKKEVDTNSITIRSLGSEKQETMELKESIKKVLSLSQTPL